MTVDLPHLTGLSGPDAVRLRQIFLALDKRITGVGGGTPAGAIVQFAGLSAPSGWLLADGAAVSRVEYADLFAAIGTAYGAGDGSTTFNLPDLKGRVPVGLDAGQTEFDVLGESGGAKTHVLTEAQLPAHDHSINHDHASFNSGTQSANHTHGVLMNGSGSTSHNHAAGLRPAQSGNDGSWVASGQIGPTQSNSASHVHSVNVPSFSGTSGSTGSGAGHNILQPYITLNYIIKA